MTRGASPAFTKVNSLATGLFTLIFPKSNVVCAQTKAAVAGLNGLTRLELATSTCAITVVMQIIPRAIIVSFFIYVLFLFSINFQVFERCKAAECHQKGLLTFL